jgi:hypothetical protein
MLLPYSNLVSYEIVHVDADIGSVIDMGSLYHVCLCHVTHVSLVISR